MDKYQKNLFLGSYFSEKHSNDTEITKKFCCISKKNLVVLPADFDITKDVFTIHQDEDIFSTEYYICFQSIAAVSKVFYCQGKQEIEVHLEDFPFNPQKQGFCVTVDFNNRTKYIRFRFKENLADDYILKLKYVESDKDVYYVKQEQKRKDDLLAALALSDATGPNLVNIYFQPCSKDYAKTEIQLYRNENIIAKYTIDGEMYFKSIAELANGQYHYIVKQFNKKGDLLIESPKKSFYIRENNYVLREHEVII